MVDVGCWVLSVANWVLGVASMGHEGTPILHRRTRAARFFNLKIEYGNKNAPIEKSSWKA